MSTGYFLLFLMFSSCPLCTLCFSFFCILMFCGTRHCLPQPAQDCMDSIRLVMAQGDWGPSTSLPASTWPEGVTIIIESVIFFIFLGLVPVPVELGKIAACFLKLGKIINHNCEEKNGIERLFWELYSLKFKQLFPFSLSWNFFYLLISYCHLYK